MAVLWQARFRFVGLVVEVVGSLGVVVGLEVIAVHVQPVINNGHGRVLACDAGQPDIGHVDVVADLDWVEQVPLLVEDGVVDAQRHRNVLLLLDGGLDRRFPLFAMSGDRSLSRGYDALLPWLPELLLLREQDAVQDVAAAEISLPPPPRRQLPLDNVLFLPLGHEYVVILELAEGPFVGESQTPRNVGRGGLGVEVEDVVVVGVVVSSDDVRGRCQGGQAQQCGEGRGLHREG